MMNKTCGLFKEDSSVKYLVLNTRNCSESLLKALTENKTEFRVYVLDNNKSTFLVNEKNKDKPSLAFQTFNTLYSSLEEAENAINTYNRQTTNVLFKPLILECNGIKAAIISKDFFEKLSFKNLARVVVYDYETATSIERNTSVINSSSGL